MIKLKIRSKRNTAGKRKGKVLYFAHQCPTPRTSLEDIAKRIESATALSKADVHSCIIALQQAVALELKQGRAVDLGELGTLRPIVSGRMMDRAEEVTASTLKTPQIVYHPSKELRKAVEALPVEIQR